MRLSPILNRVFRVDAPKPNKPLAGFWGELKTPPMGTAARVQTGQLLRRLQRGETLGMPVSRPMPSIGPGVHELRIDDRNRSWRIFYLLGGSAVVVLGIAEKRTQATPKSVIEKMKARLRQLGT